MAWLCNSLALLLAPSPTELSAAKVRGKVPMLWVFGVFLSHILFLFSISTLVLHFFPSPNDATDWPEVLPLLCSQTEPIVYK